MVKKCRSVQNNVLSMWVCRNMLFSFELRKSFNFFWCDSSKPQSFRICVHNIVFPVNHWRIALAYLHTYIHTSKPNSSLTPFPLPPPKKKPPKKPQNPRTLLPDSFSFLIIRCFFSQELAFCKQVVLWKSFPSREPPRKLIIQLGGVNDQR